MAELTLTGKAFGYDQPNADHSLRDDHEWLFAIISDYLQPHSKESQEETILQLDKHDSFEKGYLAPLMVIILEISDQVPFDHPSMQKLAELLVAFYTRSEWAEKQSKLRVEAGDADDTPERTYFKLREQLNIQLYDCLCYPDDLAEYGEDPILYVNACAFRAYLSCCGGDFYYYASWLQKTAFMALDEDEAAKEMKPGIGDAYVMGPAIYVLYSADAMFDRVGKGDEYPKKWSVTEGVELKMNRAVELDSPDAWNCWPLRRLHDTFRTYKAAKQRKANDVKLRKAADKAIQQRRPNTWEQWQAWERLLRAAAEDSRCSERARNLAREAADRMVSLKSEWDIDQAVRESKMKQ
jgi:hypothetical protein